MKAKKLTDLPIPQSGCGNSQLVSDGVSLTLRFEYRKAGGDQIGTIQFNRVIAHRFRDEVHSLGYASEAYESIAEILDSTWCTELKFDGKHFAVFLSSNGYFEVLAQDYVVGNPEQGLLEVKNLVSCNGVS